VVSISSVRKILERLETLIIVITLFIVITKQTSSHFD
jgi:hypothetical protein